LIIGRRLPLLAQVVLLAVVAVEVVVRPLVVGVL
jgi:hypothetical protein